MVTNKYFDDKVKLRAKETGIKLIDRDALLKLDKTRKSGFYISLMVFRFLDIFESSGLNAAVNYLFMRNLSLDEQIKKYTE